METYLGLSSESRRAYCTEVGNRRGLPPASIEKDFWVCWTLRELTRVPEWGENLSFKGGTSLSKAWHLIDRFSEDIDIVIDRKWLDFTEDRPGSRKLEHLQEICSSRLRDDLLPLLMTPFKTMLAGDWQLRIASLGEGDSQKLIFEYPGLFMSEINYLKPHVKIEFGARSDTEPSEIKNVRPFLHETLTNRLGNGGFDVRTVSVKRTFWEKALLLHEENSRAERSIRPWLSRHYYDLWSIIDKGMAQEPLEDLELFWRIVRHREVYFRIGSLDYETMSPGKLRICPPTETCVKR